MTATISLILLVFGFVVVFVGGMVTEEANEHQPGAGRDSLYKQAIGISSVGAVFLMMAWLLR